jgi:hypothetical protein
VFAALDFDSEEPIKKSSNGLAAERIPVATAVKYVRQTIGFDTIALRRNRNGIVKEKRRRDQGGRAFLNGTEGVCGCTNLIDQYMIGRIMHWQYDDDEG